MQTNPPQKWPIWVFRFKGYLMFCNICKNNFLIFFYIFSFNKTFTSSFWDFSDEKLNFASIPFKVWSEYVSEHSKKMKKKSLKKIVEILLGISSFFFPQKNNFEKKKIWGK